MINGIREICDSASLHSFVHDIELELVDDPDWSAPDDHSYLSNEEKADPETVANLEAMARTNELIWWIGRDFEGFVGLWRGPQLISPEGAPVARLDTEGQYRIVAANFPDYLLASVFDDQFDATRAALADIGTDCSASLDQIFNAIDALGADEHFVDPNAFRNDQYERLLASHD